jgi:membrane fusion protein, multidrug efflux system
MLTNSPRHFALGLCLALCLSACGKSEEKTQKVHAATLITTFVAQTTNLEIREETVGTLEGLMDPTVSAEVPGLVIKVLARPGQTVKKNELLVLLDPTDLALQKREAESEVRRIEALLANQGRAVDRNEVLVQKNFISKNALDDVTTQQASLKEQLAGARSRLDSIEHANTKTSIVAPLDGKVEKQIVSEGDYVKVGDPLMQIISNQRLRAHLPFPEGIAAKLQPGLNVRLFTPTSGKQATATIRELKPLIDANSRAVDIVADVVNEPGWQSGASVNGTVILGEHTNAVVVPEQSIVLRPAGEVVYIIKNNVAAQRLVKTGLRQEGKVEVVEGLAAGEQVAVDGASYLTDKAAVTIQNNGPQQAKS